MVSQEARVHSTHVSQKEIRKTGKEVESEIEKAENTNTIQRANTKNLVSSQIGKTSKKEASVSLFPATPLLAD